MRSISLFILCVLLAACGAPPPSVPPSRSANAPPSIDAPRPRERPQTLCGDSTSSHAYFRLYVDGSYVGREVRSRSERPGPFGEEIHIFSSLSRRVRSGALDYDLSTIRSELTTRDGGSLLRGHFTAIDPMFARVALVGFNGSSFERVFESHASVDDPVSSSPESVPLTGHEVVGLRLVDHLRAIDLGAASSSEPISFYDPSLTAPVPLTFSSPSPGVIELDGARFEGHWVCALRDGGSRVFTRVLFDATGLPVVEEYPSLHQTRVLSSDLPPFPSDATHPSTSLLSRAYLGVPDQATHAVFRISAPPGVDPASAFSFLGEPKNQTLSRDSDGTAILVVSEGAPDGRDPPNPADTRPAPYIESNSPQIVGALQYLRSAGRTGSLPAIRRANATPIVARASLIQNPTRFWKDPVSVANIVSRFVFAILPDKRATFSMADAVTTLEQGTGDCTEHSVLFTALMRAHGIPTRLVAGLYLSQGGYWVYHMWATYWDGSAWRQVDPIADGVSPGALYVAIGRGATRFTDVRPDVAAFLNRAFSGVSFDLISASSSGEALKLSYPRTPGGTERDTALFNASVLAVRGDARSALAALDAAAGSDDTATVNARLFRAELLAEVGDFKGALAAVSSLRRLTSLPANTQALDAIELESRIALGDRAEAEALLAHMEKSLVPESPTFLSQKARFLFAFGAEGEALDLIAAAVSKEPDSPVLLLRFVDLVSRSDAAAGADLLGSAEAAADRALDLSHYADPRLLAAAARLEHRLGRDERALSFVDSGLVLAPFDAELLAVRRQIFVCDKYLSGR